MAAVELRTAAWYGDAPCTVAFPDDWDVAVHWPQGPRPLTDADIAAALESPVGQPPIRELSRGARRPVIVVDDLKRPTPVSRVLPFVLRQFAEAGIGAPSVTIVMATGTHGPGPPDAAARKLGREAAAQCRVVVHDPARGVAPIGRTWYGTPVKVNREVAEADFVMGVGGIYPNHTAGFGGGSKLALGVSGIGTIARLHYRHQPAAWGTTAPGCTFREDLNAIARMIRMDTMISLQIDAERQPVRIACGDHFRYYAEEVAFARRLFGAPLPADEDVLVCNAYPNDLSVTFAGMKGMLPLQSCRPEASRIAIAACPEGIGTHGLFPLVSGTPLDRVRNLGRRALAMEPARLGGAVIKVLRRRSLRAPETVKRMPLRLFRPCDGEPLPAMVAGIRVVGDWEQVIAAVRAEHPGRRCLRVSVYPCAPIQFFEAPGSESAQTAA